MPTMSDFLEAAKWSGALTLAIGALALCGFIFKWGIRFRLVGVTGFMAVLTGGIFALGLVPFTRTVVPGAVHFSRVYDNGATQAVIAVPPDITQSQLQATMQQAASDLFSPGRMGQSGEEQLTVRVRTVLHPDEGVSELLYLGEVRRSLLVRNDEQLDIHLYPDAVARLPKAPATDAVTDAQLADPAGS
ncbi:MAG: Ycf51 family protein [Synechococcales bacterium]|nr:Ycf51 family protein [Synechococcales bacterium]